MNLHRLAPLNWLQWVTLGLLLAFAVTTPLLFNRVQSVQAHENDALRSIICFAEQRARTSPVLSAEQRRQAIQFYDQALIDARLQPCSKGRP